MAFKQRPPFFLVWNPKSGYTRRRHKSVEAAEAEAQRLSDVNPGIKFHILMALGRCTADKKASAE